MYVIGTSGEHNVPHGWNIVKYDGAYYQMDVTYADANNALGSLTRYSHKGIYNYAYLLASNQMMREHKIDKKLEVPTCDESKDCYYVRNQRYSKHYEKSIVDTMMNEFKMYKNTFQWQFEDTKDLEKFEKDIRKVLSETAYTYIESEEVNLITVEIF